MKILFIVVMHLVVQALSLGSFRHGNREAFRERSSKRRHWKTLAFRFHVDGKPFGRGNVSKANSIRTFHAHKSKMAVDCCVFKFLQCRCERKTFDAFSE